MRCRDTLWSQGWRAALTGAVLGLIMCLVGFGVRAGAQEAKPKLAAEAPKQQMNKSNEAYVSGLVKDEAGRPVAGAAVALEGAKDNDKPLAVKSGADGRYAFPALVDDPNRFWILHVLAGKEGFAPAMGSVPAFRFDPAPRADGRGHEAHIDLTLGKPGTFTGTVHGPEGRPVAGARVQFGTFEGPKLEPKDGIMVGGGFGWSWRFAPGWTLRGTPVEPFFVARTDAKGVFRFTTVPTDKPLGFRVEADGMADLDTTDKTLTLEYFAKPDSRPLNLVVVREGRINGRVISRVPGVSVSGVHMWLHPAVGQHLRSAHQAWTDADGRFTFRGLPECVVSVQPHHQMAAWVPKVAPIVTLKPESVADVEIELIEGVLVEGKVLAADDGEPVARAAVAVHGPARPRATGSNFWAVTNREGRYRLRLPPGETEFFLQQAPKGFARPSPDEPAQRVTIPEGVKTFTGPTLTVKRTAAQ